MIRVPASVRREFHLDLAPEAALTLMRDVPRWGALFPGVAQITPLDTDVWRWEMHPMGPPGMQVRTVYACHYAFDEAAQAVTWTPRRDIGNASFAGAVRFAPAALRDASAASSARGRTAAQLWLDAELEIPAPRFVAGVVRPALALEFNRMTDQFIKRLIESARDV